MESHECVDQPSHSSAHQSGSERAPAANSLDLRPSPTFSRCVMWGVVVVCGQGDFGIHLGEWWSTPLGVSVCVLEASPWVQSWVLCPILSGAVPLLCFPAAKNYTVLLYHTIPP